MYTCMSGHMYWQYEYRDPGKYSDMKAGWHFSYYCHLVILNTTLSNSSGFHSIQRHMVLPPKTMCNGQITPECRAHRHRRRPLATADNGSGTFMCSEALNDISKSPGSLRPCTGTSLCPWHVQTFCGGGASIRSRRRSTFVGRRSRRA